MKSTKRKSTPSPAASRGISHTFWIQSEDLTRLKSFAAENELSLSNVINRALRRYLDNPKPFSRP